MTPNEKLAREIVYSDWGDDSTLLARIAAALDAKDKAMAELLEALEFYGDSKKMKNLILAGVGEADCDDCDRTADKCLADGSPFKDTTYTVKFGKRARAALAKLRGET